MNQNAMDNGNNNKPSDNNELKKVFKILSIIVAISGCGLGILSIINSFTMRQSDFFGPVLNIFAFYGGIALFIYTAAVIGVLWIIYGIIVFISDYYRKVSADNKQKFKRGSIVGIAILLIGLLLIINYNYHNKNLMKVLDERPIDEFYDTTSYYFMYKDKIYYYRLDHDSNYNPHDKFFVMDFDGKHNKKLAEGDELRYAMFYFVYNDEAYYYTTYYGENKKINLNTGKITSLNTKDNYIPITLNNGIVHSFVDNAVAGDSYSIFKKIDIRNNNVISEIKTNDSVANDDYYFDYDGGNIYYEKDFSLKHPMIYKNNEPIYEFSEYSRYGFPEINFIAVNKDYLYYIFNNIVYKFNVNTKSIEKEFDNELNDIKRISSGNNIDNYFYSDKKIYSFDMKTDNFELVVSNIEKKPDYIYNIDNKLIFTENTDNVSYGSDYDTLGSVVVYNKLNDKIQKYDKIRKACFDEEYMYLLYQSNKNYAVRKIKLYS